MMWLLLICETLSGPCVQHHLTTRADCYLAARLVYAQVARCVAPSGQSWIVPTKTKPLDPACE